MKKVFKFFKGTILSLMLFSLLSIGAYAANFNTIDITEVAPSYTKPGVQQAMLMVELQDNNAGPLLNFIIEGGGATLETDVSRVMLYLDDDGSGCDTLGDSNFDENTDTLLGWTGSADNLTDAFAGTTAAFNSAEANGQAGIGDIDPACSTAAANRYFLVYEFSSSATNNSTVTAQVTLNGIQDDGSGSAPSQQRTGPGSATPASPTGTTIDSFPPVITEGSITPITGGSGTGGAFIEGDVVTVRWDNTLLGDFNIDLDFMEVDFSDFGGVVLPLNTTAGIPCLDLDPDEIRYSCYTIAADFENNAANLTFFGADLAGNETAMPALTLGPFVVDSQAPVVTQGNISYSGNTGNSGYFIKGDTITIIWDAEADGNTDIDYAETDLSDFDGVSSVLPMTDTTDCGGTANDNVWEACVPINDGIDTNAISPTVIAVDDVGNLTGPVFGPSPSVDTLPTPQITNLVPSNFQDTSIDLAWDASTDPDGDFVEYRVYYSTDPSVSSADTLWDQNDDANLANIATTSTTVTGLNSGTTYYFTIYGVDAAGNLSDAAAPVDAATTGTPPPPPSQTSSGGGGSSLLLSALNPSATTPTTTTTTTTTTPTTTTTTTTSSTFPDIIGHWGQSYIEELAAAGIVVGKSDGLFHPNDPVTRAELVKMVLAALGVNWDGAGPSSYDDVNAPDWYVDVVAKSQELGITEGYAGNLFKPNNTITRAEALAVVFQAFGFDFESLTVPSDPFEDVSVTDWFAKLVYYGQLNGIIDGYSAEYTNFGPNIPLTRAEAAKIISNSMGL